MKTFYFSAPTATAEQIGSGRLFKKQVLPLGDWVDPLFPGERMTFTREFFEDMVENFRRRVAGRVSVPDTHTDNSVANKGEVVDLAVEEDGLYAYLDIRKPDAIEGIDDDTIFDVSAKFTDNYQDTKHGIWHGPTLLHVALVNNPYIKKMNPFVALADALHVEHGASVRALSESQANVKETTMALVKNTRDFPVEVKYTSEEEEVTVTLQPAEELELAEDQVEAVQAHIDAAEAPAEEQEDEGKEDEEADENSDEASEDNDDAADEEQEDEGSDKELSDTARELAETRHKLALRDIDDNYQALLRQGKLVPALEKPYKELAEAVLGQTRQLSDGNTISLSEALASFTSALPKIVALDEENGKHDDDSKKSPFDKLTKEQQAGLQAAKITPEQYNATGGRNGISVSELTQKEA